MAERELPQNISAERLVLGARMLSKDAMVAAQNLSMCMCFSSGDFSISKIHTLPNKTFTYRIETTQSSFFLDTPESTVLYYPSIQHAPKWRNWQTQQTQNLPLATTCRFKSGLRHHKELRSLRFSVEIFCTRRIGYGKTFGNVEKNGMIL